MSNIMKHAPMERQTPIEIALQVDENGMTTVRALYSFLEMNEKNFSHWIKRNIIGNRFAVEGEDYWVLVLQDENPQGGRPTIDYKLTASFAKKLAMGSNSPKGNEAKDYFVMVEQRAKQLVNACDGYDPLEMAVMTAQRVLEQQRMVKEQGRRLDVVEQKIDTVKSVFTQEEDWREMIRKNIAKIAEVTGDYQGAWAACYEELDRRGFNMKKRLENWKKRMLKQGHTKTEVQRATRLSMIERDNKARELFTGVVREMVLKYVV